MKFGVREICNVVFKAKSDIKIGTTTFKAGQPVLYIDTAKTSTVEGAATTVYATGGRGNTRLIAWEGEKTLTFTVEDALLSPIGFSVLSGAGLFSKNDVEVHVHTTSAASIDAEGTIDLTDALGAEEEIDPTAPVFVDFYVVKDSAKVSELQIDAEKFGGYYYVEASTLFRDQATGYDMPAEITLPNVKIQSNFTFSMAATGDPSTFTFTMDAMPGYTYFDRKHKVLCVIQVVNDPEGNLKETNTVMKHEAEISIDQTGYDSVNTDGEPYSSI